MSSLHPGLCPRTTGEGQEYASSPGNHQLGLRRSEIPTVSSQNLGLPQQDKAGPHSLTLSQSWGSHLCSLGALQTWSKDRGLR